MTQGRWIGIAATGLLLVLGLVTLCGWSGGRLQLPLFMSRSVSVFAASDVAAEPASAEPASRAADQSPAELLAELTPPGHTAVRDTAAASTVVYVFLSAHCPISRACVPELNRLASQASAHGVAFVGVVPGSAATADDAAAHARDYQIAFPVVHDRGNQLCRRLQATHTPQAVVQRQGVTLYSGRIDNRFADLGRPRPVATESDLADVLQQLAAGVPLLPRVTKPVGCLIEPVAAAATGTAAPAGIGPRQPTASAGLTFNRDIAPLIHRHCSHCHRPGAVAPFALLTYADVRQHASQMDVVLQRRLMPPWKPEPNFGEFANEQRLSPAELALWQQWLAEDLPEGRAADRPPEPQFVGGWQLGPPDLELIMPEAFDVPADGPDIYRHFVIPTGLTQNRLVNAVEFRPGAPEVVHHSIMYYDTTGQGRQLDQADPGPGYSRLGSPGVAVSGSLGGWGPGGRPRRLPDGMGRPLAQGADLILQVHYHPLGRPVRDQSRIGLYFAPPSATHLVTEVMVANVDLRIPAGAAAHPHHAEYVLPVDTLLFDATPHMHVLGREIKAVAHLPNGTQQPLVWIRDWDFHWQDSYVFAEPLRLPRGTRIELDCWFDNSADNPLNPHTPPQDVTWGDYSTDEMGICYFQATTDTWEDYVELNRHATQYFSELWNRDRQNRGLTE